MSEQDRLAFSEQRFKELPKFSSEMDIESIPPPHLSFHKEWEECLEDAAGIWNSMGIQDDNPPSFSCYAALMRDPDYVFMCTLRAFEYS
ncbi:unnamed protein product [Cercospora beticola]|nr:unnamed protein product [Cercospora beticola]